MKTKHFYYLCFFFVSRKSQRHTKQKLQNFLPLPLNATVPNLTLAICFNTLKENQSCWKKQNEHQRARCQISFQFKHHFSLSQKNMKVKLKQKFVCKKKETFGFISSSGENILFSFQTTCFFFFVLSFVFFFRKKKKIKILWLLASSLKLSC